MAIHRLPLWFNRNISFFKLLGCGKKGSFDIHPDWQQWGILAVHSTPMDLSSIDSRGLIAGLYGPFIARWLRRFGCETWTIFLEPLAGHGKWDGKQPFGILANNNVYEGPIAVLTRATIRVSKLRAFWKNVDGVAEEMTKLEGYISSIGIGEVPFMKQATFSLWQNSASMKQFAYKMRQHTEVIRKTKGEKWYSEDLYMRFKPLKTAGTMRGNDPLAGKL